MPPNVSGWDDTRWLDTATFRDAADVLAAATKPWMKTQYPPLALNALR
jgi:hypothetical protein